MKIKSQISGHVIDIFGIYWVVSVDGFCTETILLGLSKNSGGLVPYRITGRLVDSVDIIDPSIPGDFIYCHSGIYHKALIEEDLLDDLREYDETAYKRFLEILKAEGCIVQSLY